MLKKHTKIFLAGHRGLLGSSLLRMFNKYNYKNIITADKKKLDLRNQSKVFNFLKFHKPQIVINCAGKVGGIKANVMQSGEFIYDNLTMQTNLIHESYFSLKLLI